MTLPLNVSELTGLPSRSLRVHFGASVAAGAFGVAALVSAFTVAAAISSEVTRAIRMGFMARERGRKGLESKSQCVSGPCDLFARQKIRRRKRGEPQETGRFHHQHPRDVFHVVSAEINRAAQHQAAKRQLH